MRKIWILVSAVVFSCLFGSSYFYFFSVLLRNPDSVQDEVVNSVEDVSFIYYNQLGVYENTSKMDQEVVSLTNKGINVYTFKKGSLTVYVSHVSSKKSDTVNGQTELTTLGYSFILKECEVSNKVVVGELLSNKDYQGVLEVLYENKGN